MLKDICNIHIFLFILVDEIGRHDFRKYLYYYILHPTVDYSLPKVSKEVQRVATYKSIFLRSNFPKRKSLGQLRAWNAAKWYLRACSPVEREGRVQSRS